MSEQTAQDVVAEAVRAEVCCSSVGDAAYWYFEDQTLKDIAGAALSALRAAGYAVIPLPEPTDGPDKDGHVRFSDGSEVGTVTTDLGSGVVWSDGWEWSASQARDVAAVWAAAAAASEAKP